MSVLQSVADVQCWLRKLANGMGRVGRGRGVKRVEEKRVSGGCVLSSVERKGCRRCCGEERCGSFPTVLSVKKKGG